MSTGNRVVAAFLLLLLLLPCVALAGQAPGTEQSPADEANGNGGSVWHHRDDRGACRWFNNLFWYQIYALHRWMSRWNSVLAA